MIHEMEDGSTVTTRGGQTNVTPPAAPEVFRAVCPKCGGDVAEANVVFGWSPIEVYVSADGTRETENTEGTDMCWDSIRPEYDDKPLGCRSCCAYFTLDEVKLEPEGAE